MNKTLASVLEERAAYSSWHMPGHKGKNDLLWSPAWNEDVTELADTDNLQRPEGCIAGTQDRLAAIHGADHSFISVNGSSGMIMAMLDACFRPGDTILAVRSAHKSFFNGCIHTGLRPVYLMPERQEAWGFQGRMPLDSIRQAIREHPEVRGLFITNPTYEGYWQDLSETAEYLHREGRLLLVDEAHGAHISYIGGCPKTALAMGADAVVQSYHKTLPAPTQTAVLHIQGTRISAERMQESINTYQTTSPSYLLMKGIDQCRSYMEALSPNTIQEYWQRVHHFRDCLEALDTVELYPSVDASRIVFRMVREEGVVDGQWLYQALRQQGMELEGVFGDAVMAISTIMDSSKDFEDLLAAVRTVQTMPIPKSFIKNSEFLKKQLEILRNCDIINPPETVMTLREAYYADKEPIPLMEAAGRVSAAFVIPYPPGVPIVCPGERLTQACIRYIRHIFVSGTEVLGITGDQYILVIREKEESL